MTANQNSSSQQDRSPELQTTLDKWLAAAREQARLQAEAGGNPPEPSPPSPKRKERSKICVLLLSVFLALSIVGNVYLYFDRQNLVKRYGKLLDDYDVMEQRAMTYHAFYDAAKDVMSVGSFKKAKDAAEEQIKDETLWTLNPRWGY